MSTVTHDATMEIHPYTEGMSALAFSGGRKGGVPSVVLRTDTLNAALAAARLGLEVRAVVEQDPDLTVTFTADAVNAEMSWGDYTGSATAPLPA